MTRLECEKKIFEKMSEVRKIFEEYAPKGTRLSIHLKEAVEEDDMWDGWYCSVVGIKDFEDEDDDIEYVLNAAVFDGELYRHDDGLIIKEVEI